MAARNKKGKIHGIFKSEFQISLFHKPTMEETDKYYYIILEDLIFIKMRLLYDIVLVIDELYPLSMSYVEPYYERLFNLLKGQTSVTVVVSLIGNTGPFRQTCSRFGAPIVEKEEFLDCSNQFYSKFKNYCGNDTNRFGFYLIALKEETISAIEAKSSIIEEPAIQEKPPETPKDIDRGATMADNKERGEPLPEWVTNFKEHIINYYFGDVGGSLNVEALEKGDNYRFSFKNYVILLSMWGSNLTALVPTNVPTYNKMDTIRLLSNFSNKYRVPVTIIAPKIDVIHSMLLDDLSWKNSSISYKLPLEAQERFVHNPN